MCITIVQSDSLDTAQIVMIAGKLRVRCRCWESRLGHELVRSIVEGIVNIRTKEFVDERSESV